MEASRRASPVGAADPRQTPGAGLRIRRDFFATVAASTSVTFIIGALVFVLLPRGVGADLLGNWGRAGSLLIRFIRMLPVHRLDRKLKNLQSLPRKYETGKNKIDLYVVEKVQFKLLKVNMLLWHDHLKQKTL